EAEPDPVDVDEGHDHLSRRPGSAWAKNADAVLRISLARSSSATRFFSARTSSLPAARCDAAGARVPSSRSSSSTQFRNAAGLGSSSEPTCRLALSVDSVPSASLLAIHPHRPLAELLVVLAWCCHDNSLPC